ncbi:major capsid protein [Bacillus sp. FSL W7-1360]
MARIEDILSNVDLQSYVQQRTHELTVGDTLFPAEKTEDFEVEYILGANAAPISASIHAHDTESQVASREGFATVKQDMALIKRKIKMNEKLITALSKANREPEIQTVLNQIYNDVDNMVNSVRTRVEVMRFEALSTGKLQVNENGFATTVDYHVPEEQKVTLDGEKVWTDPMAKPLEDIEDFVNTVVMQTGTTPTRILTSRKVLNALKRHDSVRSGVYGANSARLLSNAELNTFLQAQGLPTIATEDRVYRVQNNAGGYITKRYFPENGLVVLPDGELGKTIYGVTAEEVELRNITGSQFANYGHVIAQVYSTPDPVARWTKAVAKALPSFPTANQVLIATVLGEDGKVVDGVDG